MGAPMDDVRRTARVTGLWYLGLAIAGAASFLVIRPMIHVSGDAAATASNIADRANLARLGVVLELTVVATQALAAVWFYKLFRELRPVAAASIAAFGLVNAVMILASAAFMSTAISVSGDASLAPAGDAAGTIQLLYEISAQCWIVGGLFFGLWLIPMGHAAVASGRLPKALGWTLIVGGVGYVLSALVATGFAWAPSLLVDALAIPASVGEFWMIGYLIFVGLRPPAEATRGKASG